MGNNRSTFRYDAAGARVAHVVRENGVDTRKTLYIGGFEQSRVKDGGNWTTDYTRISVAAPTGVVGTYDHKASGTSAADNTRSYYHYDHLGTIVAVTGSWLDASEAPNPYAESAGLVQRYAYDAWGRERSPADWAGTPPADLGHVDVHRGFTGHEMLRHLGLVHMNGRIYDPITGRFLSPDPFVQSPGNLQNFNRYSYVLNNPLSYTDPSGYFFKRLFRSIARFVKQYWQPILSIALAAFGQWYMLASVGSGGLGLAAGSAAHIFGSTVLGAAAGAITGGAQGAMWGALGGLAFSAVGGLAAKYDWDMFRKVLAHGITGGSMSEMQGGRFAMGFASAGISKATGGWIGEHIPGKYDGQVVAHAIVGGTVSKIGGDKFANGAVTAAFGHIFNELSQRLDDSLGANGGGSRPGRTEDAFTLDGGVVAGAASDLGEWAFSTGTDFASVGLSYTVDWYGGALLGAAAYVDGFIPILNPLEDYFSLYDSSQYGLHRSQALGIGARDTAIAMGYAGVGLSIGRAYVPNWNSFGTVAKFGWSQSWASHLISNPSAGRAWGSMLSLSGATVTSGQIYHTFYASPRNVLEQWREPKQN